MTKKLRLPILAPILGVCISVLTSCMMTAAAKNDFSLMENDFFSVLIMESIPEDFGPHGFQGIQRGLVISQARKYFLGKDKNEILHIFHANGGQCEFGNLNIAHHHEEPMVCEVSRRWILKNTGYPFFGVINDAPDYWAKPGARLVFRFHISHNGVISTELEIIDITVQNNVY